MKAISDRDRAILNALCKEKYGNEYPCDLYGRFPWDSEHRGDQRGKYLVLSKAGLGLFVHGVLKRHGNITSFFVMNPEFAHSSVFPRAWLTMAARDDFVGETGYPLNAPPVVVLS